jgi:hypothetical protein
LHLARVWQASEKDFSILGRHLRGLCHAGSMRLGKFDRPPRGAVPYRKLMAARQMSRHGTTDGTQTEEGDSHKWAKG